MIISITQLQRDALYNIDRNKLNKQNYKKYLHTKTLNCLLNKNLVEINELGIYEKTEAGRIVLSYNINHNIDLDCTWYKNKCANYGKPNEKILNKLLNYGK